MTLRTPETDRKRMHRCRRCAALAFLLACACPLPSRASYHFMQVEKVVGGVNGDVTAQAVQLRMRKAGQNQLQSAKLIALDAAGQNPIVLIDFEGAVASAQVGSRILMATPQMQAYTNPPVVADFLLARAIPESYLAAGSLIFENDDETLLAWRLSWGGAAYTGDTTGSMTNDEDREFGLPFPDPLPSGSLQVLEFQGNSEDKSGSNAADYQLSLGPATLTNNAGEEFTLIIPDCTDPSGAGPDTDHDSVRDACDECPDDSEKTLPGPCGCGASDEDGDGNGIPDCLDAEGNDNANGNTNGGDDDDNENSNDNSVGNGNANANDNDGNGNDGVAGTPRGCTPGAAAIVALTFALCGLRSLTETSRRRGGVNSRNTGGQP